MRARPAEQFPLRWFGSWEPEPLSTDFLTVPHIISTASLTGPQPSVRARDRPPRNRLAIQISFPLGFNLNLAGAVPIAVLSVWGIENCVGWRAASLPCPPVSPPERLPLGRKALPQVACGAKPDTMLARAAHRGSTRAPTNNAAAVIRRGTNRFRR